MSVPQSVAIAGALLGLLAACADGGPGAGGQCQVALVAQLPLQQRGHLILTMVQVDAAQVPMIVDTGAERSAVTAAVVTRLALLSDPRHGSLVAGIGGDGWGQNDVLVGRFALAGYDPGETHYAVIGPHFTGFGEPALGGIAGADLLSHFDLDLDVAHSRLGLYDVHHCAGRFLPWTRPYTALPFSLTWHGHITVPVTVDGHELTAMLDTGASRTMLDAGAADAVGVPRAVLAREPGGETFGAAGVNVKRVGHRFASLAVGGATVANPLLDVLDRPLREVDMLLGLDFLRRRHVWISYRTRQLFIETPAEPGPA